MYYLGNNKYKNNECPNGNSEDKLLTEQLITECILFHMLLKTFGSLISMESKDDHKIGHLYIHITELSTYKKQ